MFSASAVVKAITSWSVVFSISRDALDGEGGARLDLLDRLARDRAHLGVDFADGDLDVEPLLKLVLLRPERAHLGQRVAFNHGDK